MRIADMRIRNAYMRIAIIALIAAVAALALACGGNAETLATPVAPQPTAAETAATAQTVAPAPTIASAPTAPLSQIKTCADETDVDCVMEVSVGPELEDCVGSAPMRCMVVDGYLFYDAIEGFEHEAGYRYRLTMERYDRWHGQAPPADASKYGYRLIEVVEKARAAQ